MDFLKEKSIQGCCRCQDSLLHGKCQHCDLLGSGKVFLGNAISFLLCSVRSIACWFLLEPGHGARWVCGLFLSKFLQM